MYGIQASVDSEITRNIMELFLLFYFTMQEILTSLDDVVKILNSFVYIITAILYYTALHDCLCSHSTISSIFERFVDILIPDILP